MTMDVLDWIGGVIAQTARSMGDGTGFPIVFGTYMAMLAVERIAYLFVDRDAWDEQDAWSNVRSALFNTAVQVVLTGGIFLGIYVFLYQHARVFDVPFAWWGWALAFLLNDLAYYTDHRIAHRVGFLWAIHTTHHSSREMNLLVSNRGTVLDLGGTMSPVYFLLPILGVPPAMFLAVKFFGNLWGIFNHTRLIKRMGVLEDVLATPANHRVHHGTEPKYLDRNYGQTLIIWDRLFSSFQREEEEPTYGLVTQMESHRLWDIHTWGVRQLIAQMRSADRWADRLRYLVKPPGWSHDGNHTTTEAIVARGAPAMPMKEAR
ncbi:MAG: sterol desaturase family protein [Burkholderiaceae bacterium]